MESFKLCAISIVGNAFCVEADDGQKVFEFVSSAIVAGKKVFLSFQNVEMLTSAFLNTAIGQLYRDFSEERIREGLSIIEMEAADMILLKRVVDTAKISYKDPERLPKSVDDIAGD
jgi:hypothetical protein